MERNNIITNNIADAFKNSDIYFKSNSPALSDINIPLIFRSIFPDTPYPGSMDIPIKVGLPIKFTNIFKEKFNFTSIWKSYDLDYTISIFPGIFNEVLCNKDFIVKIAYSRTYANSVDSDGRKFILKQLDNNPETVSKIRIGKEDFDTVVYISDIEIFYDPMINFDNHKSLFNFLSDFSKAEDIHEGYDLNEASVSMLVKDGNNPYFREFSIKHDVNLDLGDLIYGTGFKDFDKNLISRLETDKKGLVLFHGAPGTGKTFYIRNLLRSLAQLNKRVIYIPPSLVDYMMEPDMLNFIINDISEEEEDTILLIEDAEPLLESRNSGNSRTTGISNLLNSTDGILNDILGLIVIATFNTDITNIDSALLRPGRLLARKEFSKIPNENLKELANKLNVDVNKIDFNKDYTIAEFTNLSDDKNIVEHEIAKKRSIGFK